MKRKPLPDFDAFIAIDWSGASGNYTGIAAAICDPGHSAPRLIKPSQNTRWSRQTIAAWLIDQLSRSKRLLVGLDFGFGLPFEPGCGYLGGKARGIDHIFALWDHIEQKGNNAEDFGCHRFLADSEHASLFWSSGTRPRAWVERKRRTEYACAEMTKTRPETLYKLVGSKQVGKASLTGIRVLRHVRSRLANTVAIWPFETIRGSALVEIYPTLFRKHATGSIAKIAPAGLNRALIELDSRPMKTVRSALSDHETDALISAAGLRSFARKREVWTPAEILTPRVQREGWIFGI